VLSRSGTTTAGGNGLQPATTPGGGAGWHNPALDEQADPFLDPKTQKFQVTAAAGGKFVSPDGKVELMVPPGALSDNATVRILPADTSHKPELSNLVPGISYYMDMGTAHVMGNQTMTVTSVVDSRAIAEMAARDPKYMDPKSPDYDPSKYSLKQNAAGDWLLTMKIDGAQSAPLSTDGSGAKPETKYTLTVQRDDPTYRPVVIYKQDGHGYSEGGRQLLCVDGCDHTKGFYTGRDIDIKGLTDWVETNEEAGYRIIDNVDALDKNGAHITMGLSQFTPSVHQQNCDFADAGCPDAGAKAQVAIVYNTIIDTSWRFPGDMVYPPTMQETINGVTNTVPNPKAGQPFPAAGHMRKPPDSIKEIADSILKLGVCVPPTCPTQVWAELHYFSDDPATNGQLATNFNDGITSAEVTALENSGSYLGINFINAAGQAGGEVNIQGRERFANTHGRAFETLGAERSYNIFGYYHDKRFPDGLVTGNVAYGTMK